MFEFCKKRDFPFRRTQTPFLQKHFLRLILCLFRESSSRVEAAAAFPAAAAKLVNPRRTFVNAAATPRGFSMAMEEKKTDAIKCKRN